MHIDKTIKAAKSIATTPHAGSPLPQEVLTHMAIGASRLRAIRLWRSRPLETLSSETGIAVDDLSTFEANKDPIVGQTRRLVAQALDVPGTWFET